MTDNACCSEEINAKLLLPSKVIMVAAIVFINSVNEILIAKRPENKNMAGLWEFPGGKIHEGETPEAALVREIKEELGVKICAGCLWPLTFASHRYEKFHLLMPLYGCRQFEEKNFPIHGAEGQELKWIKPHALNEYPMPEANRNIIGLLHDLL
jgi:8-oxo-dGTP diphosphatase